MIGIVNHSDEEGFSFISGERLPGGMFACYLADERKILCRVKHGEPLKQYPQEFLLDMELSPDEVSLFYGLDPRDFKYYSYSASVVGYFDASMGEFVNPRTCLLYTSDAADDLLCVDLGGRRIIKKKK